MQKRRRYKQQTTLEERLAVWAKEVMAQAEALPPGPEKEALLKKAQQATMATNLSDWAKTPT